MHEPPQFSRSFPPNATIAQYARVKLLSTGKIATAGLAERGIGTAMRPAFQTDVDNAIPIGVALDGPIRKGIAKEAFDAGVDLATEAGGKLQDTAEATSYPIGVALEAATAEDDIVDWMYSPRPTAN